MKLKDIQIDGFGVWTGLSVDSLPDGMTLFYGPNEAGKTTMMHFLRTMLYGFTADRRERYLPPIHGGTPGGAIRVTGPGGGYEIRRRAQLTDDGVTGQLAVHGSDGLSQGQHRLSMLLGQIDESIFTNVFAIGLRELQELSTLDDTSAADELYKLSSGLDRVSLVDCMRSLRKGRQAVVGRNDPDSGELSRLAGLLKKRDGLREEIEKLTRQGRRWSELATQRRTQQQEIEQLVERIGQWEHESRIVEVATSVRETWLERAALQEQLQRLAEGNELPDDAPSQLVQLDAQLGDRKNKLDEIKQKRRELRDKADALPLSRRMLDLQARIEAASQQGTWVEALQEQIDRLDEQVARSQRQLDADAEKLGMDEEERAALVEGSKHQLPDLSRQTLSNLSEPAKAVKEQLFRLKQARNEGLRDKAETERLEAKLVETLDHAQASNLQDAMKQQGENISLIRQCMQTEEHLSKLKRHYRDLEKESLDLATDEALPVERTILLTAPFICGGVCLLYGSFHLLNFTYFVPEPNNNTGMIAVLIGFLCLGLWYLSRERGDRGTSMDLEDCERQIDSLRRQLREVEAERDELQRQLPSGSGPLEIRLREAEEMLALLESMLPTYHSHLAASQRYKTSRQRAAKAADALKDARAQWKRTLESLGLSESLSPSSIRKLSEGYETVLVSQRRVEQLQNERQERQRELASLAKRIESLYLEAVGPEAEAHKRKEEKKANDYHAEDEHEFREVKNPPSHAERSAGSPPLRKDPLGQLNQLNEELARQQHWIKRRRELVEQDNQYKRQQASINRALERLEQNRRSLWARCGVATAEQFYELVDQKASAADLKTKRAESDKQIRKMIGAQCEYDEVACELEGVKLADLERRWESLTQRVTQAQERADGLRTRQGELAQEMKQLTEDHRLSMAQLEMGCVERQIEALGRRWQTLGMASALLEDVCATVEKERQPETLREASSFLSQLTDGKYTRIWTPLGTNRLNIDSHEGDAIPLEVLSRGTREAVFIALRLSLAAAYARRGVMLPLILDDVLVNFDRNRAVHAARTLKTFAELGHQVLMFTCHEHIAAIFQEIEAQVRLLPEQGTPGEAAIMEPLEQEPELIEEETSEEEAVEEEAEIAVDQTPEPEPAPPRKRVALPIVAVAPPEPETVPMPAAKPPQQVKLHQPAPQLLAEPPRVEPERAAIDWMWYEQEDAPPENQQEWDEDQPAEHDDETDVWWSQPPQTTTR